MSNCELESNEIQKSEPQHLDVLEYIQRHPEKCSNQISTLEALIGYKSGL